MALCMTSSTTRRWYWKEKLCCRYSGISAKAFDSFTRQILRSFMAISKPKISSSIPDSEQKLLILDFHRRRIWEGTFHTLSLNIDASSELVVTHLPHLLCPLTCSIRTGTPFWMAPELLRGESNNTAATDVYSFGIILYEVYSRRDPYEGEDPMLVLKEVMDRNIRRRPAFPANMPAPVQSLMRDCIDDDPEKRPTFEELDTRLKRADAEDVDAGHGTKKSSAISLFDIFPRHIAEALRDGRTIEPEHKESVTIFFCDIVGFTEISAKLPPRKVADMLDRLYTKFDALSQKHDVFKVETIGDAYSKFCGWFIACPSLLLPVLRFLTIFGTKKIVAVTNLVKDQGENHCKRIAEFAIDAVAAANGTYIDMDDRDKGFVNIRVGFHSGPIVADVVGTRNPRYCLFGDTVNTASRMESNSKKNRIHCSRNSANLLTAQWPGVSLKSRGLIPIKGKDKMHTFWVNEQGDGRSREQSPTEREMMKWVDIPPTEEQASHVFNRGRPSPLVPFAEADWESSSCLESPMSIKGDTRPGQTSNAWRLKQWLQEEAGGGGATALPEV